MKLTAGERIAVALVFVLIVCAALSSCSLFSATTPKSGAVIGRSATDADGSVVKDADAIKISNEWATDNFTMDVAETYDTSTGAEVLKERKIFFARNTDPTVAGEVAKVRAEATERYATTATEAAVTAGASIITGQATSAASGVLEAINEAVEESQGAEAPAASAPPEGR